MQGGYQTTRLRLTSACLLRLQIKKATQSLARLWPITVRAEKARSASVARLVDELVFGNPRHHGAQLSAHHFDAVL